MPLDDGTGNDGVALANSALADEIEALTSIYDGDTLILQPPSGKDTTITAILRLPDSDISFLISFPAEYPDAPPQISGTQSTGDHSRRGQGEVAVSILRDVLGRVFSEGQVCLFDLVEEAGPLLLPQDDQNHETHAQHHGTAETAHQEYAQDRSASPPLAPDGGPRTCADEPPPVTSQLYSSDSTFLAAQAPQWTLSEPLTVNKSTFVARACAVHSLDDAQHALAHLVASNKKVAQATHNISAWRIKSRPVAAGSTNGAVSIDIVIQDSDDDGETAAGGRLLHLMQLMDVWNVLVVVSRWYGGVKLGPDRFRLINQVGRDALVKGGFVKVKDQHEEGGNKARGKGRGKK
ncbi:hypothetical protein G647_03630 [Cladophialophora carrionii CBS 160.54]|uniref:RWD domain-containing protein n=1 Tax=Cladophialophora carrionii CBS 160.54 TaxID=1279043 RepID=V9DC26_9EURO|nr:uncharacterized protein G647_03630 [Cladophialophora carrionii CBS 160.54]ETI24261.1 hypothetical protein G647_03630 [Cladophialophora carrionii CBS 160.54]